VPKLHLQVTSIICGHAVRIQESNCLASAEDDYINTKPGCSNLLGMGPENRLFATFLTESKIPKSKSQKRRGRRKEKVLYFSNTPRNMFYENRKTRHSLSKVWNICHCSNTANAVNTTTGRLTAGFPCNYWLLTHHYDHIAWLNTKVDLKSLQIVKIQGCKCIQGAWKLIFT
jgi:hypothetical protein